MGQIFINNTALIGNYGYNRYYDSTIGNSHPSLAATVAKTAGSLSITATSKTTVTQAFSTLAKGVKTCFFPWRISTADNSVYGMGCFVGVMTSTDQGSVESLIRYARLSGSNWSVTGACASGDFTFTFNNNTSVDLILKINEYNFDGAGY